MSREEIENIIRECKETFGSHFSGYELIAVADATNYIQEKIAEKLKESDPDFDWEEFYGKCEI